MSTPIVLVDEERAREERDDADAPLGMLTGGGGGLMWLSRVGSHANDA